MSAYSLVLFLHLASVVGIFWYGTWIYLGEERLWAAPSHEAALDALQMTHHGSRMHQWMGLALLVTGGYLVHLNWRWSMPWVSAAMAGLIVLEAAVGISSGRQRRMMKRLQSKPEEFEAAVGGALKCPVSRSLHVGMPLLALGIVMVMTTKPDGLWSAVELVAYAGAGALLGLQRGSGAAGRRRAAAASGERVVRG